MDPTRILKASAKVAERVLKRSQSMGGGVLPQFVDSSKPLLNSSFSNQQRHHHRTPDKRQSNLWLVRKKGGDDVVGAFLSEQSDQVLERILRPIPGSRNFHCLWLPSSSRASLHPLVQDRLFFVMEVVNKSDHDEIRKTQVVFWDAFALRSSQDNSLAIPPIHLLHTDTYPENNLTNSTGHERLSGRRSFACVMRHFYVDDIPEQLSLRQHLNFLFRSVPTTLVKAPKELVHRLTSRHGEVHTYERAHLNVSNTIVCNESAFQEIKQNFQNAVKSFIFNKLDFGKDHVGEVDPTWITSSYGMQLFTHAVARRLAYVVAELTTYATEMDDASSLHYSPQSKVKKKVESVTREVNRIMNAPGFWVEVFSPLKEIWRQTHAYVVGECFEISFPKALGMKSLPFIKEGKLSRTDLLNRFDFQRYNVHLERKKDLSVQVVIDSTIPNDFAPTPRNYFRE